MAKDEQPQQAEGVDGKDVSEIDLDAVQARRQRRQKQQSKEGSKRVDPERKASVVGPDGEELTASDIESRAERKKLVAQLLTRGVVNDRLDVSRHIDLDPSRHYEWIRETDQDIERARSLGFRIETRDPDEVDKEERHEAGDNRIRIGDVLLMSCTKDHHQLIKEVKDEQKERRRDAEKREYLNKAARENPEVPVVNPQNVQTTR